MQPNDKVVRVFENKQKTRIIVTYSSFVGGDVVVLCKPYGFIIRKASLDSKNTRKVTVRGNQRFISTQIPIAPGEYPYEIEGDDFIVSAPITSRC